MEIAVGMKKSARTKVTEEKTARAVKSGSLPVLATPVMMALMEEAAASLIEDCFDSGLTSVGIKIDVSHNAPTPIGGDVTAEATVTAIDGRKISFALRAFDNAGEIALGSHERFLVDSDRFVKKAVARLK